MMGWLRALYEWTMDKAAHPHSVWWLAFFCFAESFIFPIPPHPLLGLMCLAAPHKAIRFALIATVSSVVGALIGYAIGYALFDVVGAQIIDALGLTEAFPQAQCTFDEYGVVAVIIAAATPVPFKLLTITAGFMEMALLPFLLASLAGRAAIFMTVGILFRLFGRPIKAIIDKYLGLLTFVFALLLIGGVLVLTQLGGGEEDGKATGCAAVPNSQTA